MSRTTLLQERRMQTFQNVLGHWQARRLSALEAAEMLGMSERSFRRYRRRYEDDGLDGLFDPDLADAGPRDGLEGLAGDRLGAADLAGQHHPVGRDQGLASHTGIGIERQVGIDHRVGNAVADLVRVPFRHRFAGEQVFPSPHGFPRFR